jgi:hypothetical protein
VGEEIAELEGEEFGGDNGDEFNTEARRHGGRTEGLWPAGLRPGGRTRDTAGNSSDAEIQWALEFPAVFLVRAARSAAPQAFSHAAFKLL